MTAPVVKVMSEEELLIEGLSEVDRRPRTFDWATLLRFCLRTYALLYARHQARKQGHVCPTCGEPRVRP